MIYVIRSYPPLFFERWFRLALPQQLSIQNPPVNALNRLPHNHQLCVLIDDPTLKDANFGLSILIKKKK